MNIANQRLSSILRHFTRSDTQKHVTSQFPRKFSNLQVSPQSYDDLCKVKSYSDGIKRPRRIILTRHGESVGNLDERVFEHTPDWKVPLSPKGFEQAKGLGKTLRKLIQPDELVRFYVSPFYRTRQTYQGISESFEDLLHHRVEEIRLREQDFGNYQDPSEMIELKKERNTFGHFFYRFPDGESSADVHDRVSSFLESLFRSFDRDEVPDVIIIVAHGLLVRLFLMRWFKWTVEEFEALENLTHCQVVVMDREQGQDRFVLKTPLRFWKDPKAEWEKSILKD